MTTHLLNNALITEIATDRGAWTREQLGILGVPWPPSQGWRKRLVAEKRTLSDVEVEELREARTTVAERRSKRVATERPTMPCPWCRRLVEPVMQGGNVREFCNKRHKTDFNNALTKAAIEHARLLRTPGALKSWTETRVNPSQSGGSAPQAPGTPNGEPERQDGPLAAPRVSDVT